MSKLTSLRNLGVSSLVTMSLIAASPAVFATPQPLTVSEDEAYDIAIEAYNFFYPLVSMDMTRKLFTNVPTGQVGGLGEPNMFHHKREFPAADFRVIVRPNFDTLYSSAWVDLTESPQIITAPDTDGRYYLLPMLDMWTNVFASPGSRTSGTQEKEWLVVPQGWEGEVPEGMSKIESPTPYFWVIGRTQTNGAEDYKSVHAVQDGFTVRPLIETEQKEFKPDAEVIPKSEILYAVEGMSSGEFFSYATELMQIHPPQIYDWTQLARLERIGIVGGEVFNYDGVPEHIQKALDRAVPDAIQRMADAQFSDGEGVQVLDTVNGWQMDTSGSGVFGVHYLKRSTMAKLGLGVNLPEDAIYPNVIADADGNLVVGEESYVIRFEAGELPPVNAFWSLTVYDKDGFQVPNELNRFALGDRDELTLGDDGSLELYIQSEAPSEDKMSNWLPSPSEGNVVLQMRMYEPKAEALDGRWTPAPVQRVSN